MAGELRVTTHVLFPNCHAKPQTWHRFCRAVRHPRLDVVEYCTCECHTQKPIYQLPDAQYFAGDYSWLRLYQLWYWREQRRDYAISQMLAILAAARRDHAPDNAFEIGHRRWRLWPDGCHEVGLTEEKVTDILAWQLHPTWG